MTRRERMERRLERREGWGSSARQRSDAAFATAARRAEAIPFGQPILVGHHSEKRDRRYRERIHAGMDRGLAEHRKAEHHAAKARGLAIALERSIFDDDPDAIERLEAKVQKLEEICATGKRVNALWRKGGSEAVAAEFGEALASSVAKTMAECRWLRSPCDTTNDRAEIRRCKERITRIRARQQQAEVAAASGGVALVRYDDVNWCRVTFAEKPDREVLAALRAAGFRWGQGSWQGRLSQLPSCVEEMAKAASEARPTEDSLPAHDERDEGAR